MTASPTLPGVLVRTIAPLLSTAPNMSACVIPADVIPSVIETNLIAFIDSKEGRWRTVFPSALHRKRRSSEIRLAGIRRGFGCSCHSTAPAAVSGVPWKRPVWPREPERRFRVCAVKRWRFPAGASPARQPLQPEATGAAMEVTKWLKPLVKRVTNW